MTGKEPLPALPRGCAPACAVLLIVGFVLWFGGLELAGRAAVALVWPMMLVETLKSGEFTALGDWGARRETRPVNFWIAVALLAAVSAFALLLLVEEIRYGAS